MTSELAEKLLVGIHSGSSLCSMIGWTDFLRMYFSDVGFGTADLGRMEFMPRPWSTRMTIALS